MTEPGWSIMENPLNVGDFDMMTMKNNLIDYYDKKITKAKCDKIFQIRLNNDILDNWNHQEWNGWSGNIIDEGPNDCGPNSMCALGMLQRDDAVKLAKNVNTKGDEKRLKLLNQEFNPFGQTNNMRGMYRFEINQLIQHYIHKIESSKKEVTVSEPQGLRSGGLAIIKDQLNEHYGTICLLHRPSGMGHVTLLVKWNGIFRLVDPQQGEVYDNDYSVSNYFNNEGFTEFSVYCISNDKEIKEKRRKANAMNVSRKKRRKNTPVKIFEFRGDGSTRRARNNPTLTNATRRRRKVRVPKNRNRVGRGSRKKKKRKK